MLFIAAAGTNILLEGKVSALSYSRLHVCFYLFLVHPFCHPVVVLLGPFYLSCTLVKYVLGKVVSVSSGH